MKGIFRKPGHIKCCWTPNLVKHFKLNLYFILRLISSTLLNANKKPCHYFFYICKYNPGLLVKLSLKLFDIKHFMQIKATQKEDNINFAKVQCEVESGTNSDIDAGSLTVICKYLCYNTRFVLNKTLKGIRGERLDNRKIFSCTRS